MRSRTAPGLPRGFNSAETTTLVSVKHSIRAIMRGTLDPRQHSMNPGRNEPCPCGSGRKYKHCCGAPEAAPPESPEDLQWRRLRRAIEPLPVELLRFSGDYFGPMGLAEAWDEFTGWEDVPFDARSPHIPVFMPWFFHNWTPDLPDTEVRMEARAELTAAQAYLARKGRRLDPLARRYLEACVGAPFSFFDASACEPGRGFTLRDILTGEECRVTERSASRSVHAGDVLFAKIARLEGLAVMEACSTVIIPPDRKLPVLELRKHMREAEAQLPSSAMADWEMELIGTYLELADVLLNPQPPQLQNTDGEALAFHKLVFEIESPRAAFDALKGLALDADDAELLGEAERDENGVLRRVQFPWQKRGNAKHKGWDNTVLGTLGIDGSRLTAEVNSEQRAKLIREIIEEHLGSKAKHLATEIQSTEAMLKRAAEGGDSEEARASREEHERLAALPEVRQAIAAQMRAHFEQWADQEIPALGGQTPRQAVKDPEGREMVAALILKMERDGAAMSPPIDASIVRELRQRLGV